VEEVMANEVMEVGVAVDAGLAPSDLAAMARSAEAGGLDLLVLDHDGMELDAWTTAVWLAGLTDRIQVGVVELAGPDVPPDPSDPEAPYPQVVAKARQSLDVLAGTRLLANESWVRAPRDAGREQLCSLNAAGRPVVVSVRTQEEIDRFIDLVAAERRSGSGRGRTAAARSHRRTGISYDDVPTSLADTAVEPGDPEYRSVSSTYLRGGAPGLVLRPRTPGEVADAVSFASRHKHLPLGIRSGGHGVSGRSTNEGGLVIDVGAMDEVEVIDRDRRLVRIGPGATWKKVAAALDPYGWALGSGDYGGVGVGGLATAGGIGLLSRKYGLTIDHLRAVEMVLADGTQVRASSTENPELFWAARGAGANFGVATAFEFEVDEVAEVGWAHLVLVVPDIAKALRRFGELGSTAPRDTTVFFMTGPPWQGQLVVQLFGLVDSPDPDVIVERLTPFAEIGALAQQQIVVTRYRDVMAQAGDVGPEGHRGMGDPVARSAFLPALTPEFADDAAKLLESGEVHFFQLRSMAGAIADVSPEETAFFYRSPAFQVTAMGSDDDALSDAWNSLAAHFEGLYLSFDTDRGTERVRDAFPPHVFARLRKLKQYYDPANLFRDNFNINPGPQAEDEGTARVGAGPNLKEYAS
jgi:FAD/FMN-containing dehydrogenase